MGYLLSIVVPTKDRYIYLEKLVDLIISFQTEEIELVIQDNSKDNAKFNDFISERINRHSWIKYYYNSQYLTSVQNFDCAVKNCTGDYICFIGDDDGVVRNITRYTKWMKENDIEALRSARSIYYWPGEGKYQSYATFEPCSKGVEWLSPIHELAKILKGGCVSLGRIPVLYTGIVKKSVLDKIYLDLGTYFPGVSPDAANGTVLSFYVKRYVFINTPVVITGTSKMTGGGIQKKRLVPITEVTFLRLQDFETWEGYLPAYWTGAIVWPLSVISALRKVNHQELIQQINLDKVLAFFCFQNKDYTEKVDGYIHNKVLFRLFLFYLYFEKIVSSILDKTIRVVSHDRRFLGGSIYFNLNEISRAEELFNKLDIEYYYGK